MSKLPMALLDARKNRGLSQATLSQLSGIYVLDINYFESGKKYPTAVEVSKIAKALQMAPNEANRLMTTAGYLDAPNNAPRPAQGLEMAILEDFDRRLTRIESALDAFVSMLDAAGKKNST